jgi:hypothetical protein
MLRKTVVYRQGSPWSDILLGLSAAWAWFALSFIAFGLGLLALLLAIGRI